LAYIYSITNLTNNKQYIGLTLQLNPYDRWKKHISDSKKPEYPIHCAMSKYGIDNFKFRVIEECPDTIVEEKEIFYIDKYDTYCNGYNATLGGRIRYDKDSKPISCYTKNGEWVEDYPSVTDAANAVNGDIGHIGRCANGARFSAYNYRWSWKGEPIPKVKRKFSYPYYGYDINGNYKEWDTLYDCAEDLKCDRRNIMKSVKSSSKNKRLICGWFIFKKGKRKISFSEIIQVQPRRMTREEAREMGILGAKKRWGDRELLRHSHSI
jgi:hypothetical protein